MHTTALMLMMRYVGHRVEVDLRVSPYFAEPDTVEWAAPTTKSAEESKKAAEDAETEKKALEEEGKKARKKNSFKKRGRKKASSSAKVSRKVSTYVGDQLSVASACAAIAAVMVIVLWRRVVIFL